MHTDAIHADLQILDTSTRKKPSSLRKSHRKQFDRLYPVAKKSIAPRISIRAKSSSTTATMPDERDVDPERHLKRLQKVFGVSKKIQELALSTVKGDDSTRDLIKEAEALTRSKAARGKRIESIEPHHQYIIDMVAELLDVPADEMIAGIADSEQNVDLLHSMVKKMGAKAVIFLYDEFMHPSKGEPESHENEPMKYLDVSMIRFGTICS